MKAKFLIRVVAFFLAAFLIAPCVFATVAVNDKDGYIGEATNITFTGVDATTDGSKVTIDTNTTTENLTFKTSIIANGHKDGVTTNVSTETNLTSAALAYGTVKMIGLTTGIKYLSLANGTKGQCITLVLYPRQGYNIVLQETGVEGSLKRTGWDKITFDNSCDAITLLWLDDTNGWIIVGNNGCAVTTPNYPS